MIIEIKSAARRQLATDGANLSLRAIAREMDMVSSAIYRYFASRDDLLTALIIDCYNEMGEAAEQAVAFDGTPMQRWLAYGHGMRDWALTHPAEYALLYGSPVPGYKAPQDTIGPASRTTNVLVGMLTQVHPEGLDQDLPIPAEVEQELARFEVPASDALLMRGITAWVQLFGLISFELFGRLNNLIEESRRSFFDHQLRVMARHIGL